MLCVFGGELTGFCDDDRGRRGAGSLVFVPRDRVCGFTVTSDEPARAIIITGPSQLDRQIAAHGTPAARS
jgi:hypothetical protein